MLIFLVQRFFFWYFYVHYSVSGMMLMWSTFMRLSTLWLILYVFFVLGDFFKRVMFWCYMLDQVTFAYLSMFSALLLVVCWFCCFFFVCYCWFFLFLLIRFSFSIMYWKKIVYFFLCFLYCYWVGVAVVDTFAFIDGVPFFALFYFSHIILLRAFF